MAQGAKEFGRGIFQGVTGVVMEVSEQFVINAAYARFSAVVVPQRTGRALLDRTVRRHVAAEAWWS